MTQAYPLHWPEGRARTRYPERSRFDVTMEKAREELVWEVERLGGSNIVISTNLPLRRDGYPYSDRRQPDDTGIAVYFTKNGRQMCFACDRWDRVRDNMRAIQHTIAALRGIERWGTGEMVSAAFTGFEALPPPGAKRPWWQVLRVPKGTNWLKAVEEQYRALAREHHPDNGGTPEAMAEINAAIAEARKELKGTANG